MRFYIEYIAAKSMPTHINSFSPVPTKNDKKEPSAACIAEPESFLLTSISPANAPKNGPINGPTGHGRNIPTKSPTTEPQIPAVLPPNRLVIHGARNMSINTTTTIIAPHTTNSVVLKRT